MTRYYVLRNCCGCGVLTAATISFLNWVMNVPNGRAVFMNLDIEWTNTK